MHTVASLVGRATSIGINVGLAWAERQAGKKYGWLDIVYQGVKFLCPGNPFRLSEADHYDCSEFVTRYMLQADVALPPTFDDPATVTPNDIAREFGVLKGIKS